MTLLEYGEEIRRRRVEKYREYDILMDRRQSATTLIIAGSKAEGLTSWAESDIDLLNVLKSVICVEAGVDLHSIPDYMEVYSMDTRVYPGHCRMILQRPSSTGVTLCNNALCDDGQGNALLSSSLLLDEFSKLKYYVGVPLERTGPSLPVSGIYGLNIDIVPAINCQCPGILQR
ncbi:hypothetical protein DPMN_092824 [Dreissena polymorpha]|uniref:Uncharacterized protein n=1 Tax=Dreissena polymorpha TaxID=45954 RepID=A0A9D4L304_DREPO|nr:hypothetical protein DPMN_092824 [Dreissena polymorpha]